MRDGDLTPPERTGREIVRSPGYNDNVPSLVPGGPRHRFDDPGVFSARDFMTILFKRWKVMAVFFAVVVGTVSLRTLLQSPTYDVTAAILVKKPGADVSMAVASSRPVDFRVTQEDLKSEIEILKNRELIERVVRDLGAPVSKPPSLMSRAKTIVKRMLGRPRLSRLDRRVLSISQDLDFWAVEGTHVIEFSFTTGDPVWGKRMLDALIRHYLEYRIQVHQAPQVLTFFDEQTNIALDRLTMAEDALEDYIDQTGVSGALSEQLLMALQRLDQLEASFADARVSFEQQRERVNSLKARLASEPTRLPSSSRLNRNAAADELSRALVDLRLRRDDLLTRGFSRTNVRVRDILAQIDLAEEQLAEAEQDGLNLTEINEVHRDLRVELLRSEAELQGLVARYTALQDEVADARNRITDLNGQSLPMARLDREAASAEESYLLYRRKFEETRISQAMEQQQAVNVSVARAPRRPVLPAGPSKAMVLLLAMVLGSAGALALAFGMEYLDHSFTTADDLEQQLDVAVLASVAEWEPHVGALPAASSGAG